MSRFPPFCLLLPFNTMWLEEEAVGIELHLKFYFALNLSSWQHTFEPTTLDSAHSLIIVLFFIEFFLAV